MSDGFWTSFFTCIGLIAIALVNVWREVMASKRNASATADRKIVAEHVVEVKNAAQDNAVLTSNRLDAIAKTGDATHTLVNSNMGKVLEGLAVALRRVSDLSPTDVDAEIAAKNAEAAFRDHQQKQNNVDQSAAFPHH